MKSRYSDEFLSKSVPLGLLRRTREILPRGLLRRYFIVRKHILETPAMEEKMNKQITSQMGNYLSCG